MSQCSLLYETQLLAFVWIILPTSSKLLLLTPAWPLLAPSTQLPPTTSNTPLLLSPVYIIVTVQLYLSHSAKRTGTSGSPAAPAVKARSAANHQQNVESSKAGTARKGGATRKTPSCSLQLRKSGSLSSYCSIDTPSYVSPVKSPSQYFQICY